MNEEKKQKVISDLREEIRQAKDKGLRGRLICGAYHDFLRGEVMILFELELITKAEAPQMLGDIEIACSGAWEEAL